MIQLGEGELAKFRDGAELIMNKGLKIKEGRDGGFAKLLLITRGRGVQRGPKMDHAILEQPLMPLLYRCLMVVCMNARLAPPLS